MAGLGSFSGGATLQRSKLDLSQKQSQAREIKTDDGQGGGIGGKGNINGGGGGDEDNGDDDDYFEDGDDGDGDENTGFIRQAVNENYTMQAITSVLQEWGYSMQSLPLILQTAAQMGLLSSAQLVRFCAMDNRPTLTRWLARCLPSSASRQVVGRMMADPAFVQKLLIENGITAAGTLWYEVEQRGDRFFKELDLVVINTVCLMAASSAMVWAVAPNRSFGGPSLPFQRMLAGMPSNVFDACGPQRQYTMASRITSFAAKSTQMAVVGGVIGGTMSLLGRGSTALRQKMDPSYRPSLQPPRASTAAAGLGGFMAISSNFRYQMVAGMDRYLFGHSNFLWSYLVATSVVRAMSHAVSQPSRLYFMGLPTTAPEQPVQRSPTANELAALRRRQQIAKQRRADAARAAAEDSSSQGSAPLKPKTKKRAKRSKPGQGTFALSAGRGL